MMSKKRSDQDVNYYADSQKQNEEKSVRNYVVQKNSNDPYFRISLILNVFFILLILGYVYSLLTTEEKTQVVQKAYNDISQKLDSKREKLNEISTKLEEKEKELIYATKELENLRVQTINAERELNRLADEVAGLSEKNTNLENKLKFKGLSGWVYIGTYNRKELKWEKLNVTSSETLRPEELIRKLVSPNVDLRLRIRPRTKNKDYDEVKVENVPVEIGPEATVFVKSINTGMDESDIWANVIIK